MTESFSVREITGWSGQQSKHVILTFETVLMKQVKWEFSEQVFGLCKVCSVWVFAAYVSSAYIIYNVQTCPNWISLA